MRRLRDCLHLWDVQDSSSWGLSQEIAWGCGKDVGAEVSGPVLMFLSRYSPAVLAELRQYITMSVSLSFPMHQMGIIVVLTSY